jgi:endonuclease/exonuclease/phosphatase (EEP) superfamily protein YafD
MIGDAEIAVIGGDMNCWPDSPVYAMIENDNWIDPFVAMGHLPAHTAPALGPYERIDYVWARGMEPVDAQVSSSLASDHRLVVVELARNE